MSRASVVSEGIIFQWNNDFEWFKYLTPQSDKAYNISLIQIKVLTTLPFFFPWFLVSVDNILNSKMCNQWKINISIQLNIEIPVMFKQNFKN